MLKSVFAAPALVFAAFVFVASCERSETGVEETPPVAAPSEAGVFAGEPRTVNGLKNPASFAEMFKVLSHPRCMNCHPRGDAPLQGDEMREHYAPVARGQAGMGVPGMECSTCHGATNVSYAGASGSIPGHEPWMLAPLSMGWIGLSAAEVCAQIQDPARNGGRDLEAILEHHAEDGLVGWGWEPGEGRTPAPGSQELFGALTAAWIETGAGCPGA